VGLNDGRSMERVHGLRWNAILYTAHALKVSIHISLHSGDLRRVSMVFWLSRELHTVAMHLLIRISEHAQKNTCNVVIVLDNVSSVQH